ncbi:MAG: CDP-glycerol glycerophosphotransferase family protein [Microbacterium sp.]|uniref:CDP-glycerol glycerophosphotransferase family protein n=1 Tax=Microbacterium sp. TaxID=51671 RepID=UPI001AC0FD8E|nr:CDP-glycerol glycerophosphotransferase family protein [Microbacterium sp.]MBN9153089.1 CDP-glycerol glycerophosphotransferase family protein [Microbacterium sp.]MBN9172501.1 CDP-glycerol glycerophosphotransferase family protein [Microbacterium sp.]MBN9175542.1 CDP-glycerol glycerophosphotransferase family protein [Microbacterium sp.]MBN9181954.1 CDP-glycerol glycerophosphotransferase family protein [Microbacterium sp.]
MTEARFTTDGGVALVLAGKGARPARVELVGRRARVEGVLSGRGATWRAVLPLTAARWGGPRLPLPTGDYRVRITAADGAEADEELDGLPMTMLGTVRASLQGSTLAVGPPIDPAYDSGEGQAALERRYANRPGGLENAVFFESFYGRNASDNPLAIDRELAHRAPGVTRYWSVVDFSVQVPDGAVPVVEGSPDWWRARGAARLLVVNDWLRRRFERRPGQKVVQTWHGTPLKRLALHRPGFDPRRAAAVVREARRWNVLLAQNAYAAGILRKAYAFLTRPIWVEGYPRNDVLVTGDGAATRAALGIGADERVLLYAPTWRDDREQMVDFVDPEELARDVDAVVLVRGHSRTLIPGTDAAGARVIDVTGFPDTAQLFLAADALITDYSSVMFDFSVTGKPMFFLVPDMEHYRGELRGFYFDLVAHAPGPVVRTQADLVAALRNHEPASFAAKYARWRDKFNARDDGRAAERVVARILDQGFVAR